MLGGGGRAPDLERLGRGGGEDDSVQGERLHRVDQGQQVPQMRWVEASAEDPEAHSASGRRGSGRRLGGGAGRGGGRRRGGRRRCGGGGRGGGDAGAGGWSPRRGRER